MRSRRDFSLESKILSKFTVSASPFNSVAPLIPVSLYCLQRKVSAFSSLGPLRAGGISAVVDLCSLPGNPRCILAAVAGGGNTSLGYVCRFSSWPCVPANT